MAMFSQKRFAFGLVVLALSLMTVTASLGMRGDGEFSAVPEQLTGPRDRLKSSPQGLVVFTLVRGDSFEMFVNSRRCLREVMPGFI
eukprot:4946285-Prymnesium_polylepis.1